MDSDKLVRKQFSIGRDFFLNGFGSFSFLLFLAQVEKREQKGFSSRIIKWESSQWDLFPGAVDDCVIYTRDEILVLDN